MAEEFDINPGIDLASLLDAEFSELNEAISQAAPTSKIGFVYISTSRPDITNNPRFIRYIWLDITTPSNPVFKRYIGDRSVLVDSDASWAAEAINNSSVTNAMIADYAVSVLNSANVNKISLKHNASADPAKSLHLLRVDVAGQYVEAVSLASALTVNSVPLTALDKAGAADGEYLKYSGGILSFEPLDGNAISTVPITKLSTGTALHILRTNAGGTALEFVNTDAFLQDGDVTIAKLAAGAATALQVIRRNTGNTAWEYATPVFSKASGAKDGAAGLPAAAGVDTIAHGLGVAPAFYRVVLVNIITDAGYAVGDEVPLEHFMAFNSTAEDDYPLIGTPIAGSVNVVIRYNSQNGYGVTHKTTGATTGVIRANWQARIYAWA